ncbi:MAG TPA: hypothetical protein VN150_11880 [Ochrobactrum sp.]|nr:hypothetical protein [Ochrobactrum sp.]
MMIDIPVLLIDATGNVADNPICSPCIQCFLSADVTSSPNGPFLAMLDSGAAPSAIDNSVATALNLPIVGSDTVHSALTVNLVPKYAAVMAISGFPPIQIELMGIDHRRTGHPYDLILGRAFLTMFDFGFDRESGVWRLRRASLHA